MNRRSKKCRGTFMLALGLVFASQTSLADEASDELARQATDPFFDGPELHRGLHRGL